MSKFQKALDRLKSKPRDFTWRELQAIMSHFGYEELRGGGSRRKFTNPKTRISVSLHEPHPKPILKMYVVELIIEHLKEEGLL
jgi:predicted RNA binding protein YcfA (HicA-like mRNA interferase family)